MWLDNRLMDDIYIVSAISCNFTVAVIVKQSLCRLKKVLQNTKERYLTHQHRQLGDPLNHRDRMGAFTDSAWILHFDPRD